MTIDISPPEGRKLLQAHSLLPYTSYIRSFRYCIQHYYYVDTADTCLMWTIGISLINHTAFVWIPPYQTMWPWRRTGWPLYMYIKHEKWHSSQNCTQGWFDKDSHSMICKVIYNPLICLYFCLPCMGEGTTWVKPLQLVVGRGTCRPVALVLIACFSVIISRLRVRSCSLSRRTSSVDAVEKERKGKQFVSQTTPIRLRGGGFLAVEVAQTQIFYSIYKVDTLTAHLLCHRILSL